MPPRELLALHLVPGIGPRLMGALLGRFGSPADVLKASPEDLAEVPYVSLELAQRIKKSLDQGDVDKELELLKKHQVDVRVIGEPDYPEQLASIPNPPHLLYVKGTIVPADARAIGIVGSRQCTSYGRRIAERLGQDLARAGWTVISGLARGIDACAHRGALEGGGRTFGVLAGGLSKIYPPEHAELAIEVAKNGALITETSMRMEPMAGMFPARNRIISGLSRAIVVVEAADKSGALITAVHAAEQGRDVMAIPGPIDSTASGGTNKLLRDGARLVRHAGDVLADLEELAPPMHSRVSAPEPKPEPEPNLPPDELALWKVLGEGARNVEDIAVAIEKPISQLQGLLMTLELKGRIKRLPGNSYERK